MSKPLRAVEMAATNVQNAKTTLAEMVRNASEAGHSLREIAAAAGLSHENVRTMIRNGQTPSS
jgi:DNA-binding CsgD family transcriptional regulator